MSNENKGNEEAAWRKQQEAHWKKKFREKLTMERDYLAGRRDDTAKRMREAKEDAAKRKFHEQQFLKQKAWEQRGARDEDRNK
ncbi:MAG TPA: hypothetical protein V6C97_01155 [Oculatellaceae cyanobacterium]